jgi:hypothetical protein
VAGLCFAEFIFLNVRPARKSTKKVLDISEKALDA